MITFDYGGEGLKVDTYNVATLYVSLCARSPQNVAKTVQRVTQNVAKCLFIKNEPSYISRTERDRAYKFGKYAT